MCPKVDTPLFLCQNKTLLSDLQDKMGYKIGYGDMVIMSMENYENTMKQIKMYEDIVISERQIKEGKVKDARKSLSSMRERYGL